MIERTVNKKGFEDELWDLVKKYTGFNGAGTYLRIEINMDSMPTITLKAYPATEIEIQVRYE